MDVKQSYFEFLQEQGAKEKIQAVIRKGIDEWKQQPAYEYESCTDPYTGDYSGRVNRIYGKTIGDICKTDMEVLKAYAGDSEATYASGCGLRWLRVADRVTSDIDDCLSTIKGQFIKENAEALFEEYDIEHDGSWSEDDVFLTLDEAMINEFSASLHYEWMQQEFPEYENDDFEDWHVDYLLNVRD